MSDPWSPPPAPPGPQQPDGQAPAGPPQPASQVPAGQPQQPAGQVPAGPPAGGFRYPDRQSLQTQAIIEIVVGALCGAMIPAILGIIALVKLDEPQTARALVRWGWISMIIVAALAIVAIVASFAIPGILFAIFAATGMGS